jgi:hypothetical protein
MKALALSCSPLNVLSRFPITLRSAAIGIGTRWLGGITSPWPGGPGSPPLPLPPPGFSPIDSPPLGPVLQRAVARAALSYSPMSMGAPVGEADVAAVGMAGGAVVVDVVRAVRVMSLGAMVVAGAIVVVPIGVFDVGA